MSHERELNITEYVEAAKTSSDRGRLVIIVMVTASILAFAAFWNARQGSWVNQRLHMARVASVGCPDWTQEKKSTLPPEDQTEAVYERSRKFYDLRHIHDCKQLEQIVKALEDIQTNSVNFIKVPFFGVQFDENDLGQLAGLTFAVILMWLHYSLSRELNNLNVAFTVAKANGQNAFNISYDLLAMGQVLTQPSMRTGARLGQTDRFELPGMLVKLLYFTPLAIQVAFVVDDILTFRFGWTISPVNTVLLYCFDGLLLLFIAILTVLCLKLSNHIDTTWEVAAKLTTAVSPPPVGE